MKQNPIPYYTLKQAAKILNKKFNTDAYNSKTIVSMALIYELNLYVMFFGQWSISCDCHVPIKLTHEEDENKQIYREIVLDIENIIENSINHSATLLRLDDFALENINAIGKHNFNPDCDSRGFDGFLRISDLFCDDGFNTISNILSNHYFNSVSRLSNEQINDIEILAIYPMATGLTDYNYLRPIAKPFSYDDEDQNEECYSYYPYIQTKDVLITHIQLEKILNGELNSRWRNKVTHDENYQQTSDVERRGVSIAKSNAKLAARTLAQYLWSKDTDQNTKILEMARMVHSELQNTEHHTQLPSIESVKEWLKLVAPVYAKQAGRPLGTND
ncbi:hypothetical protein [Acinetobacter populi]|uniref:Uncharacterized protein n=1 Tax=Acinetobacter populi TaxID=1582270 RepID=A0A1Z9Z3H1_9GAMM|nr:hypothetical protein [Acinetobacter populi]OUY09021.1 hypothetical protein CAP51_05305 [Acinetobacter populi]